MQLSFIFNKNVRQLEVTENASWNVDDPHYSVHLNCNSGK